jgi:hypothetical protein
VERAQIVAWLGKKPDWVTETWLSSTERISGKVKLRGNQRTELLRRAEEYLEYANGAWIAGEALLRAPPTAGDVERRRKQLRDLLPPALAKARGRPWCPLFQRLSGGLNS